MQQPEIPSVPLPASNNRAVKSEKIKLGKIEPKYVPPIITLAAVEGYGKTTAGAYTPKPGFLMARGETGYETLLAHKLVPSVDAARVNNWLSLLELLKELAGYETIVLDALGGFERLCHEFVCETEYNGDWGERGFVAYQKGFDLAVTEWLKLLRLLEKLRDAGTMVLLLSHIKVKTFKNPLGADYDKYIPDVHEKTWAATHKLCDAVLFGNFLTVVESEQSKKPEALKKGKGVGGVQRVIYTQHRDAFTAKNRLGMPDVIAIPNNPSQVWSTIWANVSGKE